MTIQELLEKAGMHRPPVKWVPVMEALGIPWKYGDMYMLWPRTDGTTITVPQGSRLKHPSVKLAIGHEIRQTMLGIPGRFDDIAYQPKQEAQFDDWARSVALYAPWFREQSRQGVKRLASVFDVTTKDIIDRALELELCHVVCQDRESYGLYREHKHWKDRRTAYFTTHPYCEVATCTIRSAFVHHLPEGYKWLGRERDEHLRALCKPHHQAAHPNKGQLSIF